MLPKEPQDLAVVKMVGLVTVNELGPVLHPSSAKKWAGEILNLKQYKRLREKSILCWHFLKVCWTLALFSVATM
jgi:hypothetical protein